MKPAPFKFFAPTSIDEALDHLENYGYDAKILAGGQSLIPTMNFRLAQPAVLIDLNKVEDLFFIEQNEAGDIRMGAMTRQRQIEKSELIKEKVPLVHEAMPFIAHPQIRNRGTIGGSIAHADPSGELPALALALEAKFKLVKKSGERWVVAQDFFIGLFSTDLQPEEILAEISIPVLAKRSGCAFQEISRRHGDYAMVGVAAVVTLDEHGKCENAAITLLSVGDAPVQAHKAKQLLIGEKASAKVIEAAAEMVSSSDIDPPNDIHASAKFRRHLAKVLTKRVLTQAFQRANKS